MEEVLFISIVFYKVEELFFFIVGFVFFINKSDIRVIGDVVRFRGVVVLFVGGVVF